MARLALMTFGILKGPYADPQVQGFVERIDAVFAAADTAPGFVDRVPQVAAGADHGWMPPARFAGPAFEARIAATLSLWEDLESAIAFSYRGTHGEALRARGDWFEKLDGPNHVAWWQDGDAQPSWPEAVERFDQLWDGEGPGAFLLQRPYDAAGTPYDVDRDRVRSLAS